MNYSVLMSVYFKENSLFLDLSLDSILNKQTFPPNEFILVCDGPLTPELNNVIERYQKKFSEVLKVYRLPQNVGLGKALNYGLDKCTNNLVARADSDDVCDPTRFEKQVRYMENHPDISVVSSYIDEFNVDWTKPCDVKIVPLTDEGIKKRAKINNPMNHMATMFYRDDIVSLGSYQDVPFVEDYHLWVRAMISGYKFANIGECLVHARVGNGMVNRRSNGKQVIGWKTINDLMLRHHFINYIEYCRNMIAIYLFVKMPVWIKKAAYKTLLRK